MIPQGNLNADIAVPLGAYQKGQSQDPRSFNMIDTDAHAYLMKHRQDVP